MLNTLRDSSVLKKTFHICEVTREFTNVQNVVIQLKLVILETVLFEYLPLTNSDYGK